MSTVTSTSSPTERFGGRGGGKRIVPGAGKLLRVIRQHCLTCMGGVASEVERCTDPRCGLFPYRLGRRGLVADALEGPGRPAGSSESGLEGPRTPLADPEADRTVRTPWRG